MDAKAAERAFAEAEAAFRKGDFALAERRLNALLGGLPSHPDVLLLLGHVRLAAGRPGDAVLPLRRALAAAEAAGEAALAPVLGALGSAERGAGDAARAAEILERAARLAPGDADLRFNLGNAYWDLGRYADAAAQYRRASELSPRDAAIRFALGEALARLGDGEAALAAYADVLAIDPGHARAHALRGALFLEANDIAAARAALDAALDLDPGLAEAHVNLGLLRVQEGDAEEAIAATRRAIDLKPALARARSNLIQQMSYSARHTAGDILAEACRWNDAHAQFPPPPSRRQARIGATRERAGVGGDHPNVRDPARRLKVGYVGGDFRAHPVGWFTLSLFAHHDPARVETFVYMTHPKADFLTDKIRARVRHWHDAAGLDDVALVEAVRRDGIDILVDMAGHTAMNRLPAFARRAAPIQATGGGLGGTTGLAAIDYILADRFEIPPGYEKFYSEAVVRLPAGYVCFAPPDHAPEVAALPARAKNSVTFGCFNAAAKITPESARLWARVLAAAPGARMLVKNFGLGDPLCRARFARLFAEAGITEDRLILEGPAPHAELLAAYGRVDIALDPIPYSGGLTTLEALWMGAPTVALPGESFAARHSASHLSNAGLSEWIAKDADDYVAIAAGRAEDLDALEGLRASLRAKVSASPVCDGRAYARGLEAAFREMWRRYCAGEKPSALDLAPA
jgi:predicted O-linked N-acetylglucosamine transferase (SPINDLY family)